MSDTLAIRSLSECEEIIERGLATFVEVGQALLEIRDQGHYRKSHGTFEDYCRERWAFSRPRAYELIHAAEVVSATADIEPLLELRALAQAHRSQSENVAREARLCDRLFDRCLPELGSRDMRTTTVGEFLSAGDVTEMAVELRQETADMKAAA